MPSTKHEAGVLPLEAESPPHRRCHRVIPGCQATGASQDRTYIDDVYIETLFVGLRLFLRICKPLPSSQQISAFRFGVKSIPHTAITPTVFK
jgi:hypothetical protein